MIANVISGKLRRPRRVLLYGPDGIGKSTWAANAPRPLFLTTEDGVADIDCDKTPLIKDLGAFNGWLSDLLTQDHDYKAVVVDTLDWLERLIWVKVADANNKPTIDDIQYYRGYGFANKHWDFILKSLDHLRESRGMLVVLLAHAKAAKVEPPDADSYTRYEPDLYKTVAPMLQEWADEVFFAGYKTDVVQKDEGFNRKRGTAIGSGVRIVHTCETPSFLAKRRITLPDEMPLDFNAYMACVREAMQDRQPLARGNISDVVVNGSSKNHQPQEITNG
jgi:hypothetical protein